MVPTAQLPRETAILPARPFALRWWAVIPVVLWIGLEILVEWPVARERASSPESAAPYWVGHMFLMGLLIPLLVGILVWRFGGRSNDAATVAFVSLLGLFILADVLQATIFPKVPVAQAVRAAAEPLEVNRQSAQVQQDALRLLGGLDVQSLNTKEEIDHRLELLDHAIAANDQVLNAGDHAILDLERRMQQARIPERQRDMVRDQFAKSLNWGYGRQVYEGNEVIFGTFRKMLVLLRDHVGHWRHDESADGIQFDEAEANQEFDEMRQKLSDAIERERALR